MVATPLSEIVKSIESKKTVKQQAEAIKENDSAALKEIFVMSCCPVVEWQLPSGKPPYEALTKEQGIDQEGRFYSEVKKLNLFVNTPEGLEISSMKREQVFIELLETLHPEDALLLLRMKEKNLKIKKGALEEVYPGESW